MNFSLILKGLMAVAFCLFFNVVIAQPPGANRLNAINAGTLYPGPPFSDTKNNNSVNGFGNDYGQSSDDIYYRFELLDSATVDIAHCESNFDTYLHLLNSTGGLIASNDDAGAVCPESQQASIRRALPPGVYYVVSEGWGPYTGDITTSIGISGVSPVETGFSDQLSQIFGNLELSRVPFGLLRDIALEQASMDSYTGQTLADSNYVSMADFTAIYSTINSAKVNNLSGPFKTPEELEAQTEPLIQPNRIVLSGLFFQYSQFREDALQTGKVQVINNQVYDAYAGGVWQDPYLIKTAFAVAPSATMYRGKSQSFLLPASLWLSNSTAMVNSIDFDAGDGAGFRPLTMGQPINVNYLDTGTKTAIVRINLSNNTSLVSHFKVGITLSAYEIYPGIVVVPVIATEAFNGKYAYGTMTIRYANPAAGLQRPLIIAEGYDTGHIITPEDEFGESSLVSFINGLNKNSSGNALTQLLDGPNRQYDLVYVDWKEGTANIKKNALLLKQVIRQVNQMKATAGSNQKNVVMGLSMGGLVARWALKDMEDHQETHQTRLYVSFDSPHQGANVPVGYQFAARHLRDMYVRTGLAAGIIELVNLLGGSKSVTRYVKLLDADATRQMLIDHVKYDLFGSYINNNFHENWQSELSVKGYPSGDPGTLFRKIAVSNGSECAELQPNQPGGSLLTYNGKGSTNFLGDVLGQIGLPIFARTSLYPQFYLGILPGKNEIKFDIQINSVQSNAGNRVYHNKITYTKKLLWVLPITVPITNNNKNARTNSLALDTYPGGFMDTEFSPTSSQESLWFGKYNINISHNRRFGFIPAASALDVSSIGNTQLSEFDYLNRYKGAEPPVSPYTIPFDSFITAANNSTSNEGHIEINQRNGNWLAAELNTQPVPATDCTVRCLANVVDGPTEICETGYYTTGQLPVGASVAWTTTGNIAIDGPDNELAVSINKTANSGYGDLIAHIATPCGTAQFPFRVNIKSLNPVISNINQVFEWYNEYQLIVANPHPDWTYEWVITGNAAFLDPQADNSTYRLLIGTQGAGFFHVKLTVHDECGAVGVVEGDCYVRANYGRYVVYPNPANTEMSISLKKTTTNSTLNSTNQSAARNSATANIFVKGAKAVIYNDKMKALKSQEYNIANDGFKMDVRDIPSGMYYLHIFNGKETDKVAIIIQH